MCSIFGILELGKLAPGSDLKALRKQALGLSKLLRHRGPDWSGIWNNDKAIFVHERLSIVDTEHGAQPLVNDNKNHILTVNGEIYNHHSLKEGLENSYPFKTKSDCEVILPLYLEQGVNFIDKLEGMFAFILYDANSDTYLIARDHMGIIPLYYGFSKDGLLYVASELKALVRECAEIHEFPPGHYWDSRVGKILPYYKRDWQDYNNVKNNTTDISKLKNALEESIKEHLMSDVPYGVLLSGGLDSSLIAGICQQYVKKRIEDDGKTEAWWPRLHSFAIGLKDSPDLIAAQKVADFIGTVHHTMNFTIQEGFDAIREVIYSIETYDVTTIRASIPMYLMARKIKAMGIKMVLSGEGSDEIFGGYLYFHKAPNAKEFHEETLRKLSRLHKYDCSRANKSMSAWGIEARVPFLDKKFLDVAMSINPQDKMCEGTKIEKNILREAFKGLLPDEILWRQKEQFSDGVGYGWIDALKDHADKEVSSLDMENINNVFPVNTPDTKEGYLYRKIFEEYFPHPDAITSVSSGKSVACSTVEALAWMKESSSSIDPSGRSVQDVHGKK